MLFEPYNLYLYIVSPSSPTGPLAWVLFVEMPTSAPKPYLKPSENLVEQFENKYPYIVTEEKSSEVIMKINI